MYSWALLESTSLSDPPGCMAIFLSPSLLMPGECSSNTLSGKRVEQYCNLTPPTSSCVWHHHRCVCVHCFPLVLIQLGKTSAFLVQRRNSKESCSAASCGYPLLHSAGLPYKMAAGFFKFEMYDALLPCLGGRTRQNLKKPVMWKQQQTVIFCPSPHSLAGGVLCKRIQQDSFDARESMWSNSEKILTMHQLCLILIHPRLHRRSLLLPSCLLMFEFGLSAVFWKVWTKPF